MNKRTPFRREDTFPVLRGYFPGDDTRLRSLLCSLQGTFLLCSQRRTLSKKMSTVKSMSRTFKVPAQSLHRQHCERHEQRIDREPESGVYRKPVRDRGQSKIENDQNEKKNLRRNRLFSEYKKYLSEK